MSGQKQQARVIFEPCKPERNEHAKCGAVWNHPTRPQHSARCACTCHKARATDNRPTARTCAGCGRGLGCVAIANSGYWHLRCWRNRSSAAGHDVRPVKREGSK